MDKKHLSIGKKGDWYYSRCGKSMLKSHIMDVRVIRSVRPDSLCKTCYNRYIHYIDIKEGNIT